MKAEPRIIVDSREQCPLVFHQFETVVGTLKTGDYGIVGLEQHIAVERKALDDLLSCIGTARDRFKGELQRLKAYRFRMLVIETDAATLASGDWRSKLQPSHVLGSLSAWIAQYSLPIWLAGSHEEAGRFVERYLYQCARTMAQESEVASAFVAAGNRDSKKKQAVEAA